MSAIESVVISCAGIGSRLGLATTKALININGKSLIAWQLDYFRNLKDIRIVVGFQAQDVIKEVLKYRKDVTFIYNHNYFDTKTGMSFYLGAKDAFGSETVLEYDGDLLVHPDDIEICLKTDGEWIAYSDISSDETVYVNTNNKGEVLSFSRENGTYEWTGPACINKNKIKKNNGHVFNILEKYLPMKGIQIRACDIDTYDDYLRAIKFVNSWD